MTLSSSNNSILINLGGVSSDSFDSLTTPPFLGSLAYCCTYPDWDLTNCILNEQNTVSGTKILSENINPVLLGVYLS
jgi:hypothetical protein